MFFSFHPLSPVQQEFSSDITDFCSWSMKQTANIFLCFDNISMSWTSRYCRYKRDQGINHTLSLPRCQKQICLVSMRVFLLPICFSKTVWNIKCWQDVSAEKGNSRGKDSGQVFEIYCISSVLYKQSVNMYWPALITHIKIVVRSLLFSFVWF